MDREKSPVNLCLVQVTKAIFCCDILASSVSGVPLSAPGSPRVFLLGCLGPGPGKPMRVRFLFQRLYVVYEKHISCLTMPTIPDQEPHCPCP